MKIAGGESSAAWIVASSTSTHSRARMSITIEDPSTTKGSRKDSDASRRTASVLRALQLLDVFKGDQPTLEVSDIGRSAGIPTSTAHRLRSHLVKAAIVAKDGSSYRLSDGLLLLEMAAGCRASPSPAAPLPAAKNPVVANSKWRFFAASNGGPGNLNGVYMANCAA
jgi:hypothetical protein